MFRAFFRSFFDALLIISGIALILGFVFVMAVAGMAFSIYVFGEMEWLGVTFFFIGALIGVAVIVGVFGAIEERSK